MMLTRVCLRALVACLALVGAGAPAAADNGADDPFRPLIGDGTEHQLVQIDQRMSDRAGEVKEYTIRYTRWLPADGNGITIVYNHGFQSHRGWFNATGNELARRGFVVYAFDRIGSGESSGGFAIRRGELVELRGHVQSWRLFLETLDLMVAMVRREHPENRIVVWGNSYGAKVVAAWLLDRRPRLAEWRISGAVFTTPGFYADERSMPLPFSKMKLLFSRSLTRFPLPMVARDGDNGASWFVAPGEWFDRIENDELSLRDATRRFYLETAKLDRFWETKPKHGVIEVPVMVALVRDDEMMDNARVEQWVARRTADATITYYRGGDQGKHFLLFTADREQALADIEGFMTRIVTQ